MDKFIAHILVVDDDDGIRSLVKKYLNENKVEGIRRSGNVLWDWARLKIIGQDLWNLYNSR